MIRYIVTAKKNPVNPGEVKYYAAKAPNMAARFPTQAIYQSMAMDSNIPQAFIPQALNAIARAIMMFALNGHSVRVGEFGSFRPIIKSRGANTAEGFSRGNIKGVKIAFTPSSSLRNILQTASFELAKPEEEEEP